ncbi:hypothetical protein J7J00_17810 [Bacillus sp. ISL-4]|uniref:hypothetical protein n=1 Tax=Bacillus sp. ISL-4 TaxID=2819125 RepID=UPI001BE91798|nr:hypothetical protein [Bacillus sp. ISL-4]MBT2667336.1 hypothetical protein [Bacillus sp. ISL-4]MBT2669428.1 hypothetical protein [Streptomyces sp. ISL-14]
MKKGLEAILDTALNIHPSLPKLIEIGMELSPYLGSALQTYKMYRLQNRVQDHSEQLERISVLYSNTLLSEKFIQERIAPIVLSDLIEEHEDAKINYILHGFENVFINEKDNESLIINYFDTLRNLRYEDVKRFFYFIDQSINANIYIEESEEQALQRTIDGKLVNLGLLSVKLRLSGLIGYDNDNIRKDVILTLYGKKFAEFILAQQLK